MKQNKQSTFSNSAGAFVSRKKRTHLSVRLILCVVKLKFNKRVAETKTTKNRQDRLR